MDEEETAGVAHARATAYDRRMAQHDAGAPAGGRRSSKGRRGAAPRKRAAKPRRTKEERELDVILTAIAKPETRQKQVAAIARALGVPSSAAETMRIKGIAILVARRQGTSDEAVEQLERLRTISAAAFSKKKYGEAVRAEQLFGQIAGTVDADAGRPPPPPAQPIEVRINVVRKGDPIPGA